MTTEEEARAILWRVQQRAWAIAERLRLARLAGDPIRAAAVRAAWRPIQEMIHDRR